MESPIHHFKPYTEGFFVPAFSLGTEGFAEFERLLDLLGPAMDYTRGILLILLVTFFIALALSPIPEGRENPGCCGDWWDKIKAWWNR